MMKLIKNGNIFLDGKFTKGDILIDRGRIVDVGDFFCPLGAQEISVDGLYVIPGLVDVHVHLREPGFSYKETISTGTAAAGRGGYTTVCPMPNLDPAPDSPEHLSRQLDIIESTAAVKTIPYGTITVGQRGEGTIADFEGMKDRVVAFSDDGRGVQREELMREAMIRAAAAGKPIVAHCEVDELLRGGYIHDGDYARKHGHKGICSESEWRQVERDIRLSRETGCQYHICHVSTKESVELVRRAKAEGLRVTCETAPHYLLLCEDDLRDEGRFKMNPPLRSSQDREALLAGIASGTIDIIATDHAPHSAEEKSKGLSGSAMGIVGIEFAFPLLYTYLVGEGIITLERLIEMMTVAPRRIFGLGGGIAPGQEADLTVIDPAAKWTIDPEKFYSMGKATPFAGWKVSGDTVMTIVEGKTVYQKIKG